MNSATSKPSVEPTAGREARKVGGPDLPPDKPFALEFATVCRSARPRSTARAEQQTHIESMPAVCSGPFQYAADSRHGAGATQRLEPRSVGKMTVDRRSNCGSVRPCIVGYPFRCCWWHSKHRHFPFLRYRFALWAVLQAGSTVSSTTTPTAIPLRLTGTAPTHGNTLTARLTAGHTRSATIAGSHPARSTDRRLFAVVRCQHERHRWHQN